MRELYDTNELLDNIEEDLKTQELFSLTSTEHKRLRTQLHQLKTTVHNEEECLDLDRSSLIKLKKAIKALLNSGKAHLANDAAVRNSLEGLAGASLVQQPNNPEIGGAYLKFSVMSQKLSDLSETLLQHLSSSIKSHLDKMVSGDAPSKVELRKAFDKTIKDYEGRLDKQEKEGADAEARTSVNPEQSAESSEGILQARRAVHTQFCERMLNVSEQKARRSAELVQQLLQFYQAQIRYFAEGQRVLEEFGGYVTDLTSRLNEVRGTQSALHGRMMQLRNQLKPLTTPSAPPAPPRPVENSPPAIDPVLGTERSGRLHKRSEGVLTRGRWQERHCDVKGSVFLLHHSDVFKEPVRIPLLTSEIKSLTDESGKRSFSVISKSTNRTYQFHGEDNKDTEQWYAVLHNARMSVLQQVIAADSPVAPGAEESRRKTAKLITSIRALPENDVCADCGAPDTEWLSVNCGVLVCLQCSGAHRNLGTHISRIQSLDLDIVGSAWLVLARYVGNRVFNEIFEERLHLRDKLTANSSPAAREQFVMEKYALRRYVVSTCTSIDLLKEDLVQAVQSVDLPGLIQCYAEGADLMSELPNTKNGARALHLLLLKDPGWVQESTLLPLVDFIVQNCHSPDLGIPMTDGRTALWLAVMHGRSECARLMLHRRPALADTSSGSESVLNMARRLNWPLCVQVLQAALREESKLLRHLELELLPTTTAGVESSDEELEEKHVETKASYGVTSHSSARSPTPPPASQKPRLLDFRAQPNEPLHVPRRKPSPDQDLSGTSDHSHSEGSGSRTAGTLPRDLPSQKTSTVKTALLPKSSSSSHLNVSGLPLSQPQSKPLPSKPEGPKAVAPKPGSSSAIPLRPPKPDATLPPLPAERTHIPAKAPPGHLSDPHAAETAAALEAAPKPQPRKKQSLGPPPTPRRRRFRALFSCSADKPDELSFRKDDVIVLMKASDGEWLDGELEGQPGRRGLFPRSFVVDIT